MGWRLRLSDKTVRKFAELPTVSDTNVDRERSFWQCKVYADIRGGSLETARQMRVGIVENGDFRLFVHCLTDILHTWPHDSFQVIRLSINLGIFQSHWTVSHQISQKRCVIRQKLL